MERLSNSKEGDVVSLEGNVEFNVLAIIKHPTRSKTTQAISWKLFCFGGQTIYVKKLNRLKELPQAQQKRYVPLDVTPMVSEMLPVSIIKTGVKLSVCNIEISRRFYEKALGLPVSKESRYFVSFSGAIALVEKTYEYEISKALSQERKFNTFSIIYRNQLDRSNFGERA